MHASVLDVVLNGPLEVLVALIAGFRGVVDQCAQVVVHGEETVLALVVGGHLVRELLVLLRLGDVDGAAVVAVAVLGHKPVDVDVVFR